MGRSLSDLFSDRFLEWIRLTRVFGFVRGSRIFWRLHSLAPTEKITLPAGWVTDRRIELRKRESDPEVFEQVFIEQQYHGVWREAESPAWILDIGANVGLSALYFHHRFPRARIFAVEPSPENFAQLSRNVESTEAITPIKAALWSRVEPVVIANPSSASWSFQVERASKAASTVPGCTIDHLMKTHGIEQIDLLKIDIEGAERSVFEADTSWLAHVRVMAIELHDDLTAGCSAALFRALEPYSYRLTTTGENLVVRFSHRASAFPHAAIGLVA